jgi:glycine cleavage system regulatory protein
MTQLIVLSVIGADRAGIVQEISKVILDCGGNIEESRMTALGAEFAMLLLISGNWHTLTKLQSGLDQLTEDGSLTINLTKTGQPTENGAADGQEGLHAVRRRCCLPGPTRRRLLPRRFLRCP